MDPRKRLAVNILGVFFTTLTIVTCADDLCATGGCSCFGGLVTCSRLPQFPTSFPADTETLTISNSDLTEIPSDAFRDLLNLQTLEISHSNISRISSGAFRGLQNVEFISLFNMNIHVIQSHAFNGLSDVGAVSLYMSNIGTIESNAFTNMSVIDEISVFSVNITTVQPFAFNHLEYLLHFKFYMNNVEIMSPRSVYKLAELDSLEIYLNNFGTLGCEIVEPLVVETRQSAFYSNAVLCSCQLAWVVNNRRLQSQLFSNWCHFQGSDKKYYFNELSRRDLNCDTDEALDCIVAVKEKIRNDTQPSTSPHDDLIDQRTLTTSSAGAKIDHLQTNPGQLDLVSSNTPIVTSDFTKSGETATVPGQMEVTSTEAWHGTDIKSKTVMTEATTVSNDVTATTQPTNSDIIQGIMNLQTATRRNPATTDSVIVTNALHNGIQGDQGAVPSTEHATGEINYPSQNRQKTTTTTSTSTSNADIQESTLITIAEATGIGKTETTKTRHIATPAHEGSTVESKVTNIESGASVDIYLTTSKPKRGQTSTKGIEIEIPVSENRSNERKEFYIGFPVTMRTLSLQEIMYSGSGNGQTTEASTNGGGKKSPDAEMSQQGPESSEAYQSSANIIQITGSCLMVVFVGILEIY